jgi:1-acyl-sn-glycerol-3-phosphate acyltransferase
MPVPPRVLRRLVLAPLVAVTEAVLIVASPVLLLVAAFLSPLFGGARPLRITAIVLAFAAYHLAATMACLGLWVASGFGRRAGSEPMQRAHYAVMRWFVAGVYRPILRLSRVEVSVSASPAAEAALSATGRPVLVLSRHAGEGDTLLVIHELLCRRDRGPRVVMHEALKLDPLIDVLGDRLPNRFVDPRGGDTEVEIAAMAEELDERAALVIFPEGGNVTEERRQKSIERLERGGHAEQAGWAREMRHVSAPRPGGTLAAIEAAPEIDVVFLGHVGFPIGLGEVWRLLPDPQTIEVRLWHESGGAVPVDRDERIDWLFGWWLKLDAWVEERERARGTAPGYGAEGSETPSAEG